MSHPLVTIITPTFNRADLLPETIESVLRQDYRYIEYLVLDDGSTDRTADAIEPYRARLTYLRHENIGETATVNRGFDLAKGEMLCVVNSDDPFFTEHAVSVAVEALARRPEAVMAYSDWVGIDETGAELYRRALPQYTLANMLTLANVGLGPGVFIRRSAIDRIGSRNAALIYTGDLDHSFRLASAGPLLHLPHLLATHRSHAGAQSRARGARMAAEVLRLGTIYVDAPGLPDDLRRQKPAILAQWYLVAIGFAGWTPRVVIRYLAAAFRHSPWTTSCAVARQLRRRLWPPRES